MVPAIALDEGRPARQLGLTGLERGLGREEGWVIVAFGEGEGR